jgi:hypothetical protein
VAHVYDYVDSQVPTLMRMYKKRLEGYEAIDYSMQDATDNPRQQANEYEYLQSSRDRGTRGIQGSPDNE